MSTPATIEQCLRWAKSCLEGTESPALDSRLLLCHCLGCTQTYLMTWPDKVVSEADQARFESLIEQRRVGHPVAHLLGYRDFWTLKLAVDPSTLIPRPETELLVEKALSLELPQTTRALDLGTGTGAIALALATERPDWLVTGVDFQPQAVELARANGAANQLPHVEFLQSNWFSVVQGQTYDLIVSNPPYVEQDSIFLSQGDVRFEPRSALTSGEDGLDDIRKICADVSKFLNPDGWVVFEHGNTQAQAVQQVLIHSGLDHVETLEDLNQHPRITFGCKSR